MKEVILRSSYAPDLMVQILDGEFALLSEETDKEFYADNDEYAFAIYKLLKKAVELGAFDHLEDKNGDTDLSVDKTEIIV